MTSGGGVLAAREALLVADQLLDLLESAHARGIVHRDIKPENLFLTTDGQVKLLDFGIAHLGDGGDASEDGRGATIAGITMGTPAYMSPEQARGRWDLVGPQSDLWSVGATLFTALSGQCVHDEETTSETLAAAFTKPARSLATVVPRAPPALSALVDRALERALPDRWPDAKTMRAALRAAYIAIEGEPPPPLRYKPRISTDLAARGGSISEDTATLSATASHALRPSRGRSAGLVALLFVVGLVSSIAALAGGGHPRSQRGARTLAHGPATETSTPSAQASTSGVAAIPAATVPPPPVGSLVRRAPASIPPGVVSSAPARAPTIRSSIYDRRY
jgi:serine/threonine-protein kinase